MGKKAGKANEWFIRKLYKLWHLVKRKMNSRRIPQSTSDAHDNRRTFDNEHHENNGPPRFSNIKVNESSKKLKEKKNEHTT